MKTSRIVHTPTRSRALNVLLGVLVALAGLLLMLALAGYHPGDPSLNTATLNPHQVANWIGPTGAYISDLLLQALGVTAFALPLWLGGLGWDWMRSQSAGAAILRWVGVALVLVFVPTGLAMLPWHWHWLHVVPAEGVMGRITAPLLISALNKQGAWAVAGVLTLAGLYLSSAFSFSGTKEWIGDNWIHYQSARDRYDNWRADRADRRAEMEAERSLEESLQNTDVSPDFSPEQAVETPKRSMLSALFRRNRREMQDPEEIPAYKRAAFTELGMEYPAGPSVGQDSIQNEAYEPASSPETSDGQGRTSIWERRSRFVAEPIAVEQASHEVGEDTIPVAEPVRNIARMQTPDPSHAEPVSEDAHKSAWQDEAPTPQPVRPEPIPFSARAQAAPMQEADEENIEVHERADAELRTVTLAPRRVSGYKLPPSTLLNKGEEPLAVREEELREEARTLVEKCAEFDVLGQVVQINPGPMVTTYEFKPEAGVKYSRVTGLADDLCLAMRAESILIERMAGKSTVGIQVPNHDRETIFLRDIIESETFATAKSRLTLAMGKDINGRIVTADLAGMPHVLIAGSTGSGKSVAINAMIMSLLYRTTPEQVRLILVDPKRVELGMYEGVPHLFTPIITEPKLAANALRNAVREMERRLKLLASRSVRNIDQYNKLFDGPGMLFHDDQEGGIEERPLPFIVIVIDELADLMMLDRANVEESITRLAQMARAVGIHLVLATQRPSVDVITGLIKANVPTRMSFRLATKVDSRTIIDINGAESLLGRGDMLFLPPGTSRLMRLHAPYVSEKETAALVSFWKAQGEAEYAEGFLDSPRDERASGDSSGSDDGDGDELFDDAVRLVFEFGKASTSLLQRRLRIGYGRAAHLIDMMERDGLVGPADGSRPRELLKSPGWLHEVPAMDE